MQFESILMFFFHFVMCISQSLMFIKSAVHVHQCNLSHFFSFGDVYLAEVNVCQNYQCMKFIEIVNAI